MNHETKVKSVEIHLNKKNTYDVVLFKVDKGTTVRQGEDKPDPYREVYDTKPSHEEALELAREQKDFHKLLSIFDFSDRLAVVDGLQ